MKRRQIAIAVCLFIASPSNAMMMNGMYGPYAMSREASGTSWQPEATPEEGVDWMAGNWMVMAHGNLDISYTDQRGARGNDQAFTTNMGMLMAQRTWDTNTLGLRGMMSLEPLMGARGYPELLQTGETADGVSPLVDRQHPHDLFMELAVTGSHALASESSVFVYAGFPGEPALGPTAFMHRQSAEDNPEAPISHHWMDSTHITYGVITLGYLWSGFKIETSVFNGREPDQYRWNFDSPQINSYSGRVTYNPAREWSFQFSAGNLQEPEQLFPQDNVGRLTASGMYTHIWKDGWTATTAAWGRNWQYPIDTLDAFLLESEINIHLSHTFFARYENVQKDDLVPDEPLLDIPIGSAGAIDYHPFRPNGGSAPYALNIFDVNRFTLGYIYDFAHRLNTIWGLGVSASVIAIPRAIQRFYGDDPWSFIIFARMKIGRSAMAQKPIGNRGNVPAGEI